MTLSNTRASTSRCRKALSGPRSNTSRKSWHRSGQGLGGAAEDRNIDAQQDVLKGIDFNKMIGLPTLADLIQNIEKIPLRDEGLELPGLLSVAYGSLIKYFADSVGKRTDEYHISAEPVSPGHQRPR